MLHRLQSLPRFQAASYTQGSLKIKSAYLSPSTTPKCKASHAAIAQATHSPNPKGSLKTKKRIFRLPHPSPNPHPMKSLYILYTGGTIGMTQTPQGLQPSRDIVTTALQPHTGSLKTSAASLCEIDPTWHICDPLIDSSALTPQHWANWLTLLQAALPQHDAALILHGTDTLAYTANLLALALNLQGKPVILTGAQKPFGADNSDAPANLRTALAACQNPNVRGVLLAFNGKLIPPIGSSKTTTEHDNGFANPHFGTWQIEKGQPENAPAPYCSSLKRQFNPHTRVVPILLTPSNMLDNAAAQLNPAHSDAVILLSYGHGNAPAHPALLTAIQRYTQAGKHLLNISQVPHGNAAAVYAQGNALRQSGAINGGRCNLETATALMMLAAANGWTRGDIENELQRLRLV